MFLFERFYFPLAKYFSIKPRFCDKTTFK